MRTTAIAKCETTQVRPPGSRGSQVIGVENIKLRLAERRLLLEFPTS